MKGSYLLLIELKDDKTIQVGKLGKIFFRKGFYVYVGSALNGLEHRINRHLRLEKKVHWHIDYLLGSAKIVNVFLRESTGRCECKIADELSNKLEFVAGFGCSDCKCKSHLFYGSHVKIIQAIENLQMEHYSPNKNA